MAKLDAIRKYQLKPDHPVLGGGTGDTLDDLIPEGLFGSGADKQIAFWVGPTTLSGENQLWWDYDTDQMAVGTDGAPVAGAKVTIQDTTIDTDATYYGIYNEHTKTAGTTDHDDSLVGLCSVATLNQSGGEISNLYGAQLNATLTDGSVGDAGGNDRDLAAIRTVSTVSGGTVTDRA